MLIKGCTENHLSHGPTKHHSKIDGSHLDDNSKHNVQQKSIVDEVIHIHFPPLIQGVLDRILIDEFIIISSLDIEQMILPKDW